MLSLLPTLLLTTHLVALPAPQGPLSLDLVDNDPVAHRAVETPVTKSAPVTFASDDLIVDPAPVAARGTPLKVSNARMTSDLVVDPDPLASR